MFKPKHLIIAAVVTLALSIRIGDHNRSLWAWLTESPPTPVVKHHKAHWGYTGSEGPEFWGKLDKNYQSCDAGKEQSPVNLPSANAHFVPGETPAGAVAKLAINYGTAPLKVLNNGHTIQANVKGGGHIVVDGKRFNLLQFHFHTPSENQVDGKNFGLEAHLVHQAEDGQLAVVGVLMQEGKENAFLKQIWDRMPATVDGEHILADRTLTLSEILPAGRDFYTFPGSLTTPPCSEGVRWMVMAQPVSVSKRQIAAFAKLHPGSNRPVQALHDRHVALNKGHKVMTVQEAAAVTPTPVAKAAAASAPVAKAAAPAPVAIVETAPTVAHEVELKPKTEPIKVHQAATHAEPSKVASHAAEKSDHKAHTNKGDHGTHWSYLGDLGPSKWGALSEKFLTCDKGMEQSPVDLPPPNALPIPGPKAPGATQSLVVHYGSAPLNVNNNGHTIQVDVPGGGYIMADGVRYELLQFHFHTPSENTVAGRHAAMEAHLVHKSADGQLAVIGVLLTQGPENRFLKPIWNHLPGEVGGKQVSDETLRIDQLLPPDRSFYTFSGSLTTPPCSEGVRWMVMAMPMHLSKEQVEAFAKLHPGSNRPTQPLHARTVTLNRHGALLMSPSRHHQAMHQKTTAKVEPPKKATVSPIVVKRPTDSKPAVSEVKKSTEATTSVAPAVPEMEKAAEAIASGDNLTLDWNQGLMRLTRVMVGRDPASAAVCDVTLRRIMPMRMWRIVDIRPSAGTDMERGKRCAEGSHGWGGRPMTGFPPRYH
ncbi:MAG: carbonic anhydrase family protein [Magnetococcales bacterium]|nr:carbonic anhydrase family protein [Magnetococcales bacterium]